MSQDYLLKTEPSEYSFADLQRDAATEWEGVSNPAAVKNLREMISGARLIIYETGARKSAVGTATVVSVDASDPKNPKVKIKAGKALAKPVSLEEIKANKMFKDSPLVRMGRLSVVPLTKEQYAVLAHILALAANNTVDFCRSVKFDRIKTKQAEACSTQGHRDLSRRRDCNRLRQPAQRIRVRRACHAALADDGGDQARGRDVECRIRGGHIRSDAHSAQVRHFFGGTLFDGNLFSGRNREIERGNRRGDIERHAMLVRQDGNLVGADFVGRVAVGGDAVRAHDDRVRLFPSS